MTNNQINLPKNKDIAKQILENHAVIEKRKVDQGLLGKIWGSSTSIPNNIAALTILILLITGVFYTFFIINKPDDRVGLQIKDFWSIIIPIITLSIGYLFGDHLKKNE